MNFALRLMMFSIFLNLSVGLMQTAIPVFDEIDAYRGGMSYNESVMKPFTTDLNNSATPTGDLEDASSAFDRLLDKLNLGIIQRILELINKYMYGFINVMQTVLNIDGAIIAFLKTIITIGYVVGSWWLWSGKDVGKG